MPAIQQRSPRDVGGQQSHEQSQTSLRRILVPVGVSLCEVIHRSGGRASSVPGPQEQRVLCWQSWRRRQEALWARAVFTSIQVALVPCGRPAPPQGRNSGAGLGQVPSHHPERVSGLSPRGMDFWTSDLSKMPGCHPARMPHTSVGICWAILALTSPRSLSCRRKLSQGLVEKQQPH